MRNYRGLSHGECGLDWEEVAGRGLAAAAQGRWMPMIPNGMHTKVCVRGNERSGGGMGRGALDARRVAARGGREGGWWTQWIERGRRRRVATD